MKWREKEARIVEGVAAWELEFCPSKLHFATACLIWFNDLVTVLIGVRFVDAIE